ncbi:MAG: phasin family protein, partial [Polaromonas sp.]
MASDIQSKAGNRWDKLENIFEERVAKALGKLGVPLARDVNALAERIDLLDQQVRKLKGAGAAAGSPARPAAKPAAKPRAQAAAKTAKLQAATPAAKKAARPAAKRATKKSAAAPAQGSTGAVPSTAE